jgi:O-6-methylguanine DNA methyltransferase
LEASVPRQGLSRESVVAAAVAIADAEGLDGLSMRRLGGELGVEAMSLYNHVAGRPQLLAAIADSGWSAGDIPRSLRAHPWLLDLPDHAHTISHGAGDGDALIIGRAWLARSQKGTPMLVTQTLQTPDGPFTIIEDSGVVVGAGWTASVDEVATRSGIEPDAVVTGACASAGAVLAYYEGDPTAVRSVTVAPHGTEFRERVWEVLRTIPAGETRTYGEVAAELGSPSAGRAVGAACGANVVALFVPCHRVVGASGTLTGFAWGVETKKSLLGREGSLARV